MKFKERIQANREFNRKIALKCPIGYYENMRVNNIGFWVVLGLIVVSYNIVMIVAILNGLIQL